MASRHTFLFGGVISFISIMTLVIIDKIHIKARIPQNRTTRLQKLQWLSKFDENRNTSDKSVTMLCFR